MFIIGYWPGAHPDIVHPYNGTSVSRPSKQSELFCQFGWGLALHAFCGSGRFLWDNISYVLRTTFYQAVGWHGVVRV